MFIAMNRFQVKRGSEETFEAIWRGRESYLGEMAGFVEFNLLKGPEAEDHTLYLDGCGRPLYAEPTLSPRAMARSERAAAASRARQ